MNTKTALLLGGGALLLMSAGHKAYSATALNFYPDRVIPKIINSAPVLEMRIAVQNPSSRDFTIESFVGNLYANNFLIGNVSSFVRTKVAAHNATLFTVLIRISLIGVAADLYNAISSGGSFSQNVLLTGSADVDGILLPISIPYKIGA